MGLKKVIEEIKKNNSFLITTHVNVEGDALGSELALMGLLAHLGKKTLLINSDDVPEEYKFLPGIKNIKRLNQLKDKAFDAFIVVDCSDLGRCEKVARAVPSDTLIINIDHHISNNNFGQINWIKPYSSSTSEMIYELYKNMHVPLDRNKALCLYTGILTDTGSFHYSNTTPRSLNIAADLIGYDLEIHKIYNNIYQNIPFSDARILSEIITRMRSDMRGKVVWFSITKHFFRTRKISIDLAEHVLNFGRLIKEAEVIVLFREYSAAGGRIRVNLRSKTLNVNKIAKIFGGGGHKNASGAIVEGTLKTVERRVIRKIKEWLLHRRY
jgi:phosphoesterase RecJ-like protein